MARLRRAFVRLPAPELLFSCVAKRKVTKREGHPGWRSAGILPCECVRRCRAFGAGIVPARKGESLPGLARCAASSSPPHRRPGAPEKQRASGAQKPRQRPERSQGGARRREGLSLYALSPQIRRGVATPSIAQAGVAPKTSTQPACSFGGLNQAILSWLLLLTPGIPPFALRAGFAVRRSSCGGVGQQREVTRAPAGARNRFVPSGRRPKPSCCPSRQPTTIPRVERKQNPQALRVATAPPSSYDNRKNSFISGSRRTRTALTRNTELASAGAAVGMARKLAPRGGRLSSGTTITSTLSGSWAMLARG